MPGPAQATILVLLRALLTLVGRAAPAAPSALAAEAAALVGATPAGLVTPVDRRGVRGWRCSPKEFEEYLDAVTRAAGYVDQLQLGDL